MPLARMTIRRTWYLLFSGAAKNPFLSGVRLLRINSGHSPAKYSDCRHGSVFDADKIVGFVGQCRAATHSAMDSAKDASAACQTDGPGQ